MLGFGVGEAIAAASAIKAAVDAIKSGINTAKDVRDIAGQIDQLLDGKARLDRAKNKRVAPGQFSLSSIATQTIDAKLAEESLQEVKTLVDLRFGHATFQGILDERQKRIKEYKQAEQKRLAAKAKRRRELMNDLKILLWVVGGAGALCVAGVIYLTIAN